MDLARRSGRLADLPAQASLEHSLPLALSRINAQHQSGRPGCSARTLAIFFPADSAGSSAHRACLDHRPAGIVFLTATQTLPLSRLELSSLLWSVVCSPRQELLPRTVL